MTKETIECVGTSLFDNSDDRDLTRLLIDYLYAFFPTYQAIKDKPWTRENELDDNLPNTMPEQPLRKLLTDPRTLETGKKNIIVFRGEKEGDGKKFYLNKLIGTCYEAIPHLVWSDIEKLKQEGTLFRFPVLVDKCSVDYWLDDEHGYAKNIIDLTAVSFITKLNLEHTKQHETAKKLAEKLVESGMLALFISEDAYHAPLELIHHLLPSSDLSLLPILIFLVDRNFYPELPEGEEEKFYCIDIKPLTEYQILRYIAIELPNCPELLLTIKQYKEVITLLSKQERLLKQISTWKGNTDPETRLEVDVLQIEEDFLKEIIQDNPELRIKLREAAKLELSGQSIPQDTLDLLRETDFFNNGWFNYAESKYYLIAEQYSNKRISVTDINALKEVIIKLLCEWPPEVQYYFAAFFLHKVTSEKRKADRLDRYFNALCRALDNQDLRKRYAPATIIANTLRFINRVETKFNDFVDWIMGELSHSIYDEKVFEALSGLSDVIKKSRIEFELRNKYKSSNDPTVKRRIVYFYSRAHYPIPDEIVEDLTNQDYSPTGRHLKYHIVTAIIDTVSISESEEADWVKNAKYMDWPSLTKDPILQSEFEKLFFLKTKRLYKSDGNYLVGGIDRLIDKLRGGSYWEKAHAAGALCRRAGLDTNYIQNIIKKFETILIGEHRSLGKHRDRNCLKTISYIIEACCTLATHESANSKQPEAKKLTERTQEVFLKLIQHFSKSYSDSNTAFEIYNIAYSACFLFICGLAYLKNPKLQLRKLLGEQFSSRGELGDLLAACGIGTITELLPDDHADELEDAMQQWEAQNIFSFSPLINRKYDISAGQIYIGGKNEGMGFMFREDYMAVQRVYCITCVHLFENCNSLEQISFKPLRPEDRPETYPLKLLYPTKEKLVEKHPIEAPAKEDISIWALDGVPHDVFIELFDRNDFCGKNDKMGSQLRSYGFPPAISEFSDVHGKPLEYTYHNESKNGFCVMNPVFDQREEKIAEQTNVFEGYSGAPIVNQEGKICAMHKGNEGIHRLICIKSEVIQSLIDEKEWKYHE